MSKRREITMKTKYGKVTFLGKAIKKKKASAKALRKKTYKTKEDYEDYEEHPEGEK